MPSQLLSAQEVLDAFDAVAELYPFLPSLSLWRAWELAAYRRLPALAEPVLDIGCGDGRYFRLVWPEARRVVGVDQDPAVAALARNSGVYQTVLEEPAQRMSIEPERFASAFANCSLEHMDGVADVLRGIARALRVGSSLVMSVVTDKLVEWSMLPLLVGRLGDSGRAEQLRAEYQRYHHLVNPYSAEKWIALLEEAGFDVKVHIPIVPEMLGRVFLTLDELWHVPHEGGELGQGMYGYLRRFPEFDRGFRQVLGGVMQMEREPAIGCGAVFEAVLARKVSEKGSGIICRDGPEGAAHK